MLIVKTLSGGDFINYTNLADGALVVGTDGDDYIKNSGFDEKDNFHYADNSTLIGGGGMILFATMKAEI